MSRDPRDVCVSYYQYAMGQPNRHCDAYLQTLDHPAARLMAVITGVDEAFGEGRRFYSRSIASQFECRFFYLQLPRFCAVTFQELIGTRGGGSDAEQQAAIRRIADHLGVRLHRRDVAHIAADAYSRGSPTFRKGRTGAWRAEMTSAHVQAFKDVAGDLLVELGYESGLDW